MSLPLAEPSAPVHAGGRAYVDAEVELRYLVLAPDRSLALEPSSRPRLLVFGDGSGRVLDRPIVPGDVAVLPAHAQPSLHAGPRGLDGFEIRPTGLGDRIGPPRVEARVALAPFHEELIIAPAARPFLLEGALSLAEVLVPPGVTTSSHRLDVDERYLMLGGPATMHLAERPVAVGRGDVVRIPAGTLQHLRNHSPASVLRLYCLCTPPFRLAGYRPGPTVGHGPAGFSLDAWWDAHRASDPRGTTP